MKTPFLVGYFLGGYPVADSSLRMFQRAADIVDIFEIGYPSKDPYYDGDEIIRAHKKVMKTGLPDISYWRRLRMLIKKPLWLMAYKKDFIDNLRYRDFVVESLADILVLPDCDDNIRCELQAELVSHGMGVMGFANARTTLEQFRTIVEEYKNVYFQLYQGKTGSGGHEVDTSPYLELTKMQSDVRVFAGFGIKTAEKSRQLINLGFDGVVIGTALLKALNESESAMMGLLREISTAIRT